MSTRRRIQITALALMFLSYVGALIWNMTGHHMADTARGVVFATLFVLALVNFVLAITNKEVR